MSNRTYFKEKKLHKSFKVLAIVVFIYFCRYYFVKGVTKFIISPFKINQVNTSIDLDILATLIFLACFARIIYLVFFRSQKPSVSSWVNIVLLTTCYCLVVRFSDAFVLEPIGYFQKIKYLDVLFFALLLLITNFEYYSPNNENASINGFIEDDFHPERNIDILGRKRYAWQVALKILDTRSLKKAFVIAINSPWGFGKSGFLLLLEDFFKKKSFTQFENEVRSIPIYASNPSKHLYISHQNTILVRYNPWKNFDDKKTVQDFFDELSSSISYYDSQLSKKIKSYGSYLSKLDDSIFSKLVDITIDSFEDEQTLTNLFEKINSSIDRIKKRIVVFVDDLDRLTGDELIDILRLIRNTANFKNTFFIVAYDHNYVLNTIEKQNLISNKEEYLQKIVQLEITLPIFSKNILLQFLNEEIKKWNLLDLDFQKIDTAIAEISSITVERTPIQTSQNNSNADFDFFSAMENKEDTLIFNIFQNVRDVVRFINAYKLSYESICKFGDVYEIIMLDFLKTKYLSIYQMIASKKFLHTVDQKYEFDFDAFDNFAKQESISELNIKSTETDVIRTILKQTFSPKRIIYFRSVKYPQYFDIYFTYQTPNLTSLEKIEKALKLGIDDVIKVIDESVQNQTFDDLRSFLDSQTEFTSKAEFEIIFKTLFYIAKYDNKH